MPAESIPRKPPLYHPSPLLSFAILKQARALSTPHPLSPVPQAYSAALTRLLPQVAEERRAKEDPFGVSAVVGGDHGDTGDIFGIAELAGVQDDMTLQVGGGAWVGMQSLHGDRREIEGSAASAMCAGDCELQERGAAAVLHCHEGNVWQGMGEDDHRSGISKAGGEQGQVL